MQRTESTHPAVVGYLFWILGVFGAHRFYFGRQLSGLLYLFTGGLLGIGWIVDLFLIPGMAEEADRRYLPGKIDYNVAWLLFIFLGLFGAHRLYMEKWVSGIIYLVTGGLFGFGWLYDGLCLNEQVDAVNHEAYESQGAKIAA